MVETQKTPWHILGAGAIGSLWANYLMKAGLPVVILCRTPEQLDSFWDNPFLTLIEEGQRHKYEPKTELINSGKPIEQLLVATKSYNTEAAVASVADRINAKTRIVILQNGMGPQQQVAHNFPDSPVYCGTTTEGAYRTGPQQVIHAGLGETWIGPLNEQALQQGQQAIRSLFNLELKTTYELDIHNRLWKKLAINCAINGLTAIHDCHNGELLSNDQYRQELQALCLEFETVAAALQQPLFDSPLIQAVENVAQATAENLSSTLQDARNQRTTEIEFLNGFICQKAKELSLEMPHHQRILNQVRHLNGNNTLMFNTLG